MRNGDTLGSHPPCSIHEHVSSPMQVAKRYIHRLPVELALILDATLVWPLGEVYRVKRLFEVREEVLKGWSFIGDCGEQQPSPGNMTPKFLALRRVSFSKFTRSRISEQTSASPKTLTSRWSSEPGVRRAVNDI